MFGRIATKEEVRNARYIDSIIDIDEVVSACEIVGNYICSYGADRKRNYSKVYRYGKKLGVTVSQLVDWYTTDI